MEPQMSRRGFIRYGAAGLSLTAAGCTDLRAPDSDDAEPLEVAIHNYDTHRHTVVVDVFDPDETDDRSEARVFRERVKIAANSGEDGARTRTLTTVESRDPYRVNVTVDHTAQSHYHYLPDCQESDTVADTVIVSLRTNEGSTAISFDQNDCS
ncbi:hypothetical protein [Halorientalis sp. IM1011]|uniref:hypothetical protein n=1 Tax=Halorientalis sp. IM1011 TaxID=1932360 RepID=UPI0012F8D8D9|nr:hypothetical protein [Halorientalis sp. IM1011]